jgi:hypothetical protein
MSDEERVSESGAAATDEQRRRESLDQLKRLRVADLIEEMLVGLVTVGYQKLGLTEQTRELRDLRDAKLAIETLRAWVDVLVRERGEEGLADLRSTVAALQLSYARVAAEQPEGQADRQESEPQGEQQEGQGDRQEAEAQGEPTDTPMAEGGSAREQTSETKASEGGSAGEQTSETKASEDAST